MTVKRICGFLMPNARELCARGVGHRDAHRTRQAMDNELSPKRRPRPSLPFHVILGPATCRRCRRFVYYGESANSIRDGLPAIWRDATGQRHQCRRNVAA